MARLTREESRALTRERLLEAAESLFGRDGYATTSVEQIAEAAGFSKGALYSNFEGKEAIFLAVLERQGTGSLDGLVADVATAPTSAAVRDRVVRWADERSRSGNWSMTILEHARLVGVGAPSLRRQEAIIRGHWLRLGEAMLRRLPGCVDDAELLGALLHEIAYAPALTVIASPTAGEVMDLTLRSLFRGTSTLAG